MPTCLPIAKLSPSKTARFKSGLFTSNPNPMRDLYSKIAAEWEATPERGATLYASTEPKLRELILGTHEKFAEVDFETAGYHAAHGDYLGANMYFSYALAKLHKKLAYGYDIGGQVQEGGGTSGQGRHLWDTGNSPKHDHTQNNPSAMAMDAEAESDYPELAKFKHKRVVWPPRTR